ncbi:lipopolysaccharide assembly protein LapB [Halopseudomonas pelagia]|uniref:Lipopolysaccharide assembly protein B n=1 Tax=Halopseudomonas pelagia TaxID=553151 RepID=A0AA91U2X0_9GAMM|nr:lipopolysaccharide assembly protein LapB [Halopseudomonas pelagia]PCC99725.1 lipopolysaccharide assembly protein LapB [Halopseudomonas pelagia]QFY56413.1 lipopolysaccharide assembly protein LapB [Halopseudomonas pelagia]
MQELLFLGLFVLALGIGWFLGRREAIKVGFMLEPHGSALDRQYFIGLNYLLNEQPDEAIETFIRALEVNPETVETHIAIGKLFCQRGDVERAIKVHQNLLARPNLTREQADRVQLELARDYLVVGMLNRAERLLEELVEAASPLRAEALVDLVKVHEREHEWDNAIVVGTKLVQERSAFAVTLAHYHCERALVLLQDNNQSAARKHLGQALDTDSGCIRAMLMLAELDLDQGQPQAAQRWLNRLAEKDADFVPQALPLIRRCADNGALDMVQYLDRVIASSAQPQVQSVLARADQLKSQASLHEVSHFVLAHIQQQPSLRGLLYLIDLHLDHVEAKGRDNLLILRGIVEALVVDKLPYRCASCGFLAKKLHWQCPTCHGWSTIRPLKGREAA